VSAARLLTVMGSGETAPTMVKLHRRVAERLGPGSHRAVFLDTPFGFQENAGELCQRTVEYFRQSVGHDIDVAGLPRIAGMDTLQLESALAELRRAEMLFAGPGSPTYALRQWTGTPVAQILRDRLTRAGAVTFSSAAALTLGVRTVPVYEIYKSGADPFWLDGLDVLSEVGLPVVVIPHYDNTEGGHHDTRFCYLGERRLLQLEADLPDGVFVLGVDEHTGVLFDLEAETAEVWGRGSMTLRRDGESVVVPAGETVPMAFVRDAGRSGRSGSGGSASAGQHGAGGSASGDRPAEGTAEPAPAGVEGDRSLGEATARLESAFEAAMAAGDAPGAATAALALDDAIVEWSRDMLQSDEAERARAALRAMIVRLGQAAATGLRDPREVLALVVDAALALRRVVRSEKRYDLSDLLRDELAAAGVAVRDTPEGVVWDLLD
jgi:cyanophycinase-like exopeptidase